MLENLFWKLDKKSKSYLRIGEALLRMREVKI